MPVVPADEFARLLDLRGQGLAFLKALEDTHCTRSDISKAAQAAGFVREGRVCRTSCGVAQALAHMDEVEFARLGALGLTYDDVAATLGRGIKPRDRVGVLLARLRHEPDPTPDPSSSGIFPIPPEE